MTKITRQQISFRKIMMMTLCLLFIVSIAFNITQYNQHINNKNYNVSMYEYYMSEHIVSFNNVFSPMFFPMDDQEIKDYIHNPDHISKIIEGIQSADFFYLAASKYAYQTLKHHETASYMHSRGLINGYLSELRTYRTYLENNKDTFKDINQIVINIRDLQIISNWLEDKYKNNNFRVYSDKDFYQEVYVHLKSNVKNYHFTLF